MDIGDTFLLEDKQVDEHLWIVISLPERNPEALVIVNLTSHEDYKDQSCVLDVGDHDWIRKKTCVRYRDARLVKEADLDRLVSAGQLVPYNPATDELLRKIHAGAEITEELPNKCVMVLVEQGLIDV